MNEMAESLNIINQTISKIVKHKNTKEGYRNVKNYSNVTPHNIIKYTNPSFWNKNNLKNSYNSMESLIKHFKYWSEGDKISSN
jgi:NADH:ubiquinone oxidoreductase subunit D